MGDLLFDILFPISGILHRMKRLIIIALFLCSSVTALLATTTIEVPDFEKIERAINDRQSPYYYPDLMKKFHSNDTTMTLPEFRHLYYGYALQEDYSPYRIQTTIPSTIKQLYANNVDRTQVVCDSIIAYAHKCLNNVPFDLRQMHILQTYLTKRGNEAEAALWRYRFNGILQAILSSGDGKTPETAWHVIFTTEEYNVLNLQGHQVTERTFVEPYFDYIAVKKNPINVEGFYFNILKILEAERQKHYTR